MANSTYQGDGSNDSFDEFPAVIQLKLQAVSHYESHQELERTIELCRMPGQEITEEDVKVIQECLSHQRELEVKKFGDIQTCARALKADDRASSYESAMGIVMQTYEETYEQAPEIIASKLRKGSVH